MPLKLYLARFNQVLLNCVSNPVLTLAFLPGILGPKALGEHLDILADLKRILNVKKSNYTIL
jgi:hypothetical protein